MATRPAAASSTVARHGDRHFGGRPASHLVNGCGARQGARPGDITCIAPEVTWSRPAVAWVLALYGCDLIFPDGAKHDFDKHAMEMAHKRKVRSIGPFHKDQIDWTKAREHARIELDSLPEAAREIVERADLPVLLPRNKALLESATILGGEKWYTATIQQEGHQVFIRGTRNSRKAPYGEGDKKAMFQRPELSVTRTEGIVTCSFSLFGAAYNLEIECDRGEADPMCGSDDAAEKIVKSLGLAGAPQ